MRNAVLVPLHLDAFVGQNLTFSHQISVLLKNSEHFWAHFLTKRRHFRPDPFLSHAPNDGRICAPCVIRGARAAKSAPSWQDLRAVYSQTAVCGAFRMHGAHILPKPARFGCMARESCHELAIFPPEAAFGMHGAQNLPRIAARERTAAESCHGKTPENAPRENIATASQAKSASGRNPAAAGRWGGAYCASILPSPGAWECIASISCHRQTSENAQRRHTATASRPSRSALHAREWVQSLGCAVGFGAQHFPCEGVGISPSRGLTAGNDFESALFRWATMSSLRVLRSCAVLCAEAKSALTFI